MAAIGSHNCCVSTVFQRFGLGPFRKILPPDLFVAAAREADGVPQRERPLIPEVVAWSMIYVGGVCVGGLGLRQRTGIIAPSYGFGRFLIRRITGEMKRSGSAAIKFRYLRISAKNNRRRPRRRSPNSLRRFDLAANSDHGVTRVPGAAVFSAGYRSQ